METPLNQSTPEAPEPEHWHLAGTVLWGFLITAIFACLQVVTMLVIVIGRQTHTPTEDELPALAAAAQNDGNVLSICTIVTALFCVPAIVGVIAIKKRSSLADYLALSPIAIRPLMQWLGVLGVFVVLSDSLTLALGRPIVPPIMTEAYASAHPVWMLWLALLVFGPLFEETFFRGFLFKGLAASFVGPIGAVVVTAILWAGLHVQYDLYGLVTTFFAGVLFGGARLRSGSLIAPLALHSASNLVATLETILVSGG
jgi:CAAX protease family protein